MPEGGISGLPQPPDWNLWAPCPYQPGRFWPDGAGAGRSQLLDRICDVAISLSDEELKSLSWTTFVSGCTQPELIQYLKERRLYINEPILQEEEI